jgi:hypothetical protein
MIPEKDLKLEETQLLQHASLIETLINNEGWQRLQLIGKAQVAMHSDKLMQANNAHDHDVFLKGAIHGIQTILNTPAAILETRRAIIERNKAEGTIDTVQTKITESPDESIGTYDGVTHGGNDAS